MASSSSKQKMVQFLSRRVWDPVLKAKGSNYDDAGQKLLQTLQDKTKTQKERYHSYKSAGEVRQEFEDDLHSSAARKTNSGLKKLGLPIQADVADDFLQFADKLGVGPEKQERGSHHKQEKSTGKKKTAKRTSPKKTHAKSTTKKSSRKRSAGAK